MNRTSSNSSSPSSNSSITASPDRSNAFQVLADGTQDLAALVGILATDSVERYAVDYNRGYASTAAATLSLLGLLGYVRALVKLGLGPSGCLNAGFETRPLRPLFGIPDHDRLPSDVLHTVHYVERLKSDQYTTWKLTEARKHTVDTMPILKTALPFDKMKAKLLTMRSCQLTINAERFFIKHAYYCMPLTLTLCVGLTCFAISPFRGGLARYTWTILFATVGLFLSLLCSSLAWLWVYAREQLPRRHSDWILSRQISHLDQCPSFERDNHFAFIGKGYSYVIFDIKALSGRLLGSLRAASFLCAFTAVVGYICQYVEVRQTTPGQAAQWLLIQGVLALIRIAIWIWDPRFDDFTMEKDDPAQRVHLSEAQLVMLWYTQIYPTRLPIEMWRNEASPHYTDVPISYEKSQEQAACPPNWFNWSLPEELQIPTWAVQALDLATRDVSSVFDLARRLRKGGPTWQEDFDKFSSAELFWDMPGWIFMLWVDAHTKQTYLREPDDDKRQWNAYNCRIIQDGAGGFHFLPYWTSCRYYSFGSWDNQEEINDRYYQKVQHIVDVNEDDMPIQGRILQFEVFGDPGLENRIIWSCNSIDQRDAALPRKQELFVGWHEGLQMPPSIKRLHLEIFNHFLDGIKDHTNNMWRDLESIFARVDTQQSYERHPWTP